MPTRRRQTTKELRESLDKQSDAAAIETATRALRILTSARCSLRALHRAVLCKAIDCLTAEIAYLVNEDSAYQKAAAEIYASGEPQHVNYEVEPPRAMAYANQTGQWAGEKFSEEAEPSVR